MTLKDFYYFNRQGYMTQFFAPCSMLLAEEYRGMDDALDLLYGKYDTIRLPLIFQQRKSYGGKKMTDFMNSGWGGVLSPVSDKVVGLLTENNITGWETYPIQVFDKNGVEIHGYHGFSITGRCRDLDLSLLKERIEYQYCASGPICYYYKGIPIDLSSWDGSDIFLLAGTGHMFMHKKVFSLFKKNKITNCEYINITDFVITDSTEECFINKSFKQNIRYNW